MKKPIKQIVSASSIVPKKEVTPTAEQVIILPPNFEGGLERSFYFIEGEWKQRIGNEFTEVHPKMQKQVHDKFLSVSIRSKFKKESFTIDKTKKIYRVVNHHGTKYLPVALSDKELVEFVSETDDENYIKVKHSGAISVFARSRFKRHVEKKVSQS